MISIGILRWILRKFQIRLYKFVKSCKFTRSFSLKMRSFFELLQVGIWILRPNWTEIIDWNSCFLKICNFAKKSTQKSPWKAECQSSFCKIRTFWSNWCQFFGHFNRCFSLKTTHLHQHQSLLIYANKIDHFFCART